MDTLHTAKAWELLHTLTVIGNMNTEDYMQLCQDAGYSRDASEKAALSWANMRLSKGLPQ